MALQVGVAGGVQRWRVVVGGRDSSRAAGSTTTWKRKQSSMLRFAIHRRLSTAYHSALQGDEAQAGQEREAGIDSNPMEWDFVGARLRQLHGGQECTTDREEYEPAARPTVVCTVRVSRSM